MVANIRMLKKKHDCSISVSIDALLDTENGRYVFIEENNIAVKKVIKILAIQSDSVLVEGLSQNQSLVVLGHRSLSDGDILQVID